MAHNTDQGDSRRSTFAFLLRLVASITAPLVLITAVLWWLVSTEQVDQAAESRAATVTSLLAITVNGEIELVAKSGTQSVVEKAALDERVVAFLHPVFGPDVGLRIVGLDGVAIYSTASGEIGEITGMGDIAPSALRGLPTASVRDEVGGRQPVVYSVPVGIGGVTVAAARVEVPDDRVVAGAHDSASRLLYLFGSALLAMFIALVPLCWWSLGEVRRQFRRTRLLAMSDNLTGLANRTQFHERLDEAIAGAERSKESVGLVMLDLDGFKAINDTGGHAAGDRLLRRVAAALGTATRRNEMACRLGGDEFAVVAPRIKGREELKGLAERLHDQLDMKVEFSDGRTLRVTASLGLALYPDDAYGADELLNVADVAMYTVKASRKAKLPPEARERASSGR